MTKKPLLYMSLAAILFLLVGCGITQELDQAKTELNSAKDTMANQKNTYKQLEDSVATFAQDLRADLANSKNKAFSETDKQLNLEKLAHRQELLKELEDQNKTLMQQKKQLIAINKKNGVDVDYDSLKQITNSLAILKSNFEAVESFATVNFEQEEDFYNDLPKDPEAELTMIERGYGSMALIAEEAQANIDYTTKLIKEFLKAAPENPVRENGK
ncbi:hypothetical protein G7081_07525 [Vagococcus coleopterorum]|uniref:Cell-wall binding lipoprotein n=1 Tax=Vagococcus coleopterorum TaxID=2714946 RepID=A0A6G8APK7_9ENTE|nr:hypothetical protein [Vagococcus coleopterorum]QIL46936.1 hypothetical protein G7081_07525 [Vagococcus coleopterorum]